MKAVAKSWDDHFWVRHMGMEGLLFDLIMGLNFLLIVYPPIDHFSCPAAVACSGDYLF